MSTTIPPPGGPGAPSLKGVEGPEEIETEPNVAVAGTAEAQSAQSAEAPGHVESPTAAWLRRLEVGEVTRAQAIDGLVAEAVASHGAHLSAAQRAELGEVLRATLLDDPVLGRLLAE